MTSVCCTGCKGHACLLGTQEQKDKLYYEKPFWFCYMCIGGVSIDEKGITEIPLPAYQQPTETSYSQDLKTLNHRT